MPKPKKSKKTAGKTVSDMFPPEMLEKMQPEIKAIVDSVPAEMASWVFAFAMIVGRVGEVFERQAKALERIVELLEQHAQQDATKS